MTNHEHYSMFDAMIEELQGGGTESLSKSICTLMNVAMKIEQVKELRAGPYECLFFGHIDKYIG